MKQKRTCDHPGEKKHRAHYPFATLYMDMGGLSLCSRIFSPALGARRLSHEILYIHFSVSFHNWVGLRIVCVMEACTVHIAKNWVCSSNSDVGESLAGLRYVERIGGERVCGGTLERECFTDDVDCSELLGQREGGGRL